jgi:RND superfamily putative drug exporter
MFKTVGRLVTARPWLVCVAWLVVGAVVGKVAPPWDSKAQDDDIRFLPGRCACVKGYQLLEQAFPRDVFASKAIIAFEREREPLTDNDFALINHVVNDIAELRQESPALAIGGVTSYRDGFIGKRLVSADKHCTLVQISLGSPFLALQTRDTVDRLQKRISQRLASLGADAPKVMITGPAGLGRDLISASAHSLEGTTLATIILVVAVLLLVYRAPLLALIPLITIAASVWVSLKLLAIMTWIPGVHLVNISKIFAIVILYGAGTDYCLFLISRYREELTLDPNRSAAIRRSVSGVGTALAASAGTVICGLGMMGFAEFAKVRCAGPAIGLSLAVALVASLTLTPALLRIMGRAVFWPGALPASAVGWQSGEEPRTLWETASRCVVDRPWLIWAGAVGLLAPLAIVGLRVQPNYRSTGELPPRSESIQGVAAIQRHFTAGEIGPLTVMLTASADWNTRDGKQLISHLSRGFCLLPNVAEVRSLTQPLGANVQVPVLPPPNKRLFGGLLKTLGAKKLEEKLDQAEHAAQDFYTSMIQTAQGTRYVTRLDVVFNDDPFDKSSTATAETIRTWLDVEMPRSNPGIGHVEAELYGVTTYSHDLAEVTESDRCRVNGLVLTGILIILLVLVRKPWLAVYLLLTVLLSYYATLGATVLAGHLVNGRPLDQVEWRVPFFLFTILVAVGEDYNILLITRVLQERERFGPIEGTRRALAATGGTITSCGLIMAGTFATLMLGGLGTLIQIGFALAFGVLIDTFIIRPFLVPAFAVLVWRRWPGVKPVEDAPAEPRRIPLPQRLAG